MLQKPSTSIKPVKDALLKFLLDFRAWYMPETTLTDNWKFRRVDMAVRGCISRMIDDVEEQIKVIRESETIKVRRGTTAFLPIMLMSVAEIDPPPSAGILVDLPYMIDIFANNKIAKMRLITTAYRTQITILSSNPEDTRSIAQQFCAYVKDDMKRRFNIEFELGENFKDSFTYTIYENELYPSSIAVGAKNISIVTIDFTIVGHAPQAIGLGGYKDTEVDQGIDDDGRPIDKPDDNSNKVVTHAEQHEDGEHLLTVIADPNTGDIVVDREVSNGQ